MTWAEAKPRLTEAVKLSPRCARAHYYLGLAFKEEGANDRALGAFKKAVELDQRLLDAEREIRLMNMRRDKDKSNKPGLFDRFRKK
jgi:lipoprotein NlpI